jgi:hypothetical protein
MTFKNHCTGEFLVAGAQQPARRVGSRARRRLRIEPETVINDHTFDPGL